MSWYKARQTPMEPLLSTSSHELRLAHVNTVVLWVLRLDESLSPFRVPPLATSMALKAMVALYRLRAKSCPISQPWCSHPKGMCAAFGGGGEIMEASLLRSCNACMRLPLSQLPNKDILWGRRSTGQIGQLLGQPRSQQNSVAQFLCVFNACWHFQIYHPHVTLEKEAGYSMRPEHKQ